MGRLRGRARAAGLVRSAAGQETQIWNTASRRQSCYAKRSRATKTDASYFFPPLYPRHYIRANIYYINNCYVFASLKRIGSVMATCNPPGLASAAAALKPVPAHHRRDASVGSASSTLRQRRIVSAYHTSPQTIPPNLAGARAPQSRLAVLTPRPVPMVGHQRDSTGSCYCVQCAATYESRRRVSLDWQGLPSPYLAGALHQRLPLRLRGRRRPLWARQLLGDERGHQPLHGRCEWAVGGEGERRVESIAPVPASLLAKAAFCTAHAALRGATPPDRFLYRVPNT